MTPTIRQLSPYIKYETELDKRQCQQTSFYLGKYSSGVLPTRKQSLQTYYVSSERGSCHGVSFFPSKGILIRYTHSNAAIGSESLKNLHNQILTLKETIVSLEILIKRMKKTINRY